MYNIGRPLCDGEDNVRPLKRRKTEHGSSAEMLLSPLSSLSSASTQHSPSNPPNFQELPLPILLLSLPHLLMQPPNHKYYVQSLSLSLIAVRKCLDIDDLNPDIECRAWTALAEIGLKVITGGFSQSEAHSWAAGIASDVETATTKGLLIAQKHPSLRHYWPRLTIIGADLALLQHNSKYARKTLRKLLSSFVAALDPPHIIYTAHLALIRHLNTCANNTSTTSPQTNTRQDTHVTLAAIRDLQTAAANNMHTMVTLLACVLKLRVLVSSIMWDQVGHALDNTEEALGLSFISSPNQTNNKSTPAPAREFTDPFEASMAIHTLIMGIVYYTHGGNAAAAAPRLAQLHTLLDSGILSKIKCGDVQINFASGPPLSIQTTHPSILLLTVFLVSSAAKRDAVGRKPKRKVFAVEGLRHWDEKWLKQSPFLPWAGMDDVYEVAQRMTRIKADLLCELVGVSILRSEFEAAEEHLNELIAHTRTYDIFPSFAARVTLHQAHLAHALEQPDKALKCYRVAAHLAKLQGSGENAGEFVLCAAKAGQVALLLGLNFGNERDNAIKKQASAVAKSCLGMGSTLETVGSVIKACVCEEFIKAKDNLRKGLESTGLAQDNHLRALILALTSSHYFHTSNQHTEGMLKACEQLSAGLGAVPTSDKGKKSADSAGNVALRLWVGERYLELHKRTGDEALVHRQEIANKNFMALIHERKTG